MPGIKTDAHIVEMGRADEFHQPVRRGELVRNIFHEHPYSQWLGKGAQMLNRSHGCFELTLVKRLIGQSYVLNEKTKWNLLRQLDCTLDLIHGFDPRRPVCRCNIDWCSAGPPPLVIGVQRRVNRIKWNPAGPKPLGNLADVLLAICVIEVLARPENLDCLRTTTDQLVQQARMEPLFDVDIG